MNICFHIAVFLCAYVWTVSIILEKTQLFSRSSKQSLNNSSRSVLSRWILSRLPPTFGLSWKVERGVGEKVISVITVFLWVSWDSARPRPRRQRHAKQNHNWLTLRVRHKFLVDSRSIRLTSPSSCWLALYLDLLARPLSVARCDINSSYRFSKLLCSCNSQSHTFPKLVASQKVCMACASLSCPHLDNPGNFVADKLGEFISMSQYIGRNTERIWHGGAIWVCIGSFLLCADLMGRVYMSGQRKSKHLLRNASFCKLSSSTVATRKASTRISRDRFAILRANAVNVSTKSRKLFRLAAKATS